MQLLQFKLLPRLQDSSCPPCRLSDFEKTYIGEGSFGKVYSAIHVPTSRHYALKQISKYCPEKHAKKDLFELEQINHEMEIMYALDSPYIVKLYDHFEDEKNIYLIMELVQGIQLYNGVIRKKICLDQSLISKIIYQLCLALRHIHSRGIIHRDIKPENIILNKQLNIKLIDFGTANYTGPEHIRKTKTGSLPYFAPEIVQKKAHNHLVDVWCVGILMYELHFHKTPFEDIEKTEQNILKNRIRLPENMDPDAKDLILRILVKNPLQRITLDQILNHNWIRSSTPINNQSTKLDHNGQSSIPKSLSSSQLPSANKKQPSNSSSSAALNKPKPKRPPLDKSSSHTERIKDSSKPQRQIQSEHSPEKYQSIKLNKAKPDSSLHKNHSQNSIGHKKQQTNKANWSRQKAELEKKLTELTGKNTKIATEMAKQNDMIDSNNRKLYEINSEVKLFQTYKLELEKTRSKLDKTEKQLLEALDLNKKLKAREAQLEDSIKGGLGSPSLNVTVPFRHYKTNSKLTPRSVHANSQNGPTDLNKTLSNPPKSLLTTPKYRVERLFSECSNTNMTPKEFDTDTQHVEINPPKGFMSVLSTNSKRVKPDRYADMSKTSLAQDSKTATDIKEYFSNIGDNRLKNIQINK